ncbi:MAG: 3-phosphoshikimate 1-carboxyvinyltransferase [Syntrophus sp. (in: bacteria)]|nr:3-phosphoshikimate 1-carboxyvinyltransferase [Syntrophus sp. (in: bacteria)]
MVEIEPLKRLDATARIPGSKSYTQRAMVIAALAEGESLLRDVLLADDTRILSAALGDLGADIRTEGTEMLIRGNGGRLVRPSREIHLENNGTAMRLLAGVASLGEGPVVLTGTPRLQKRPLKPLLDALAVLGAEASTEGGLGYPPVTIRGGSLQGGEVVLRDIESSQYVSSLLIVSPFATGETTIVLKGRIPSLPYIALTVEAMKTFGCEVVMDETGRYVVKGGQSYRGREYRIEGDVSSASYFFLAAALLKGRVRVENINPRTGQGDIALLTLIERLGCRVLRGENHVEVVGGNLPEGEMIFDLSDMPDMVPTLAVLCAIRSGRSVIGNVAHLRFKESDRLAALVSELKKTGIAAEETADGMAITGGSPHGATITTYNDHRIAMSFAVLGLAVPGIKIAGEECVGKSFPGFWRALEGLY